MPPSRAGSDQTDREFVRDEFRRVRAARARESWQSSQTRTMRLMRRQLGSQNDADVVRGPGAKP